MRTKKALINLMANLVFFIVSALAGFVLPSLFIKHYGSETNGLIGSIKQFIAYLALVEAGVGAASIAALYVPLTHNETRTVNNILTATRHFYQRSGHIFLALLIVIAACYPWLVREEINPVISCLMVLILGLGGVAEYYLIGKYRVLLTADQKSYVLSMIQTGSILLSTATSVILVYNNANILIVQAIASLIYLSRYFIIKGYFYRHYPYVDFRGIPHFSAISQRWSAFIHQIAGIVVFNSPIVIITVFCGLKDVSVYVVYAMVFTAVGSIMGMFSNGLLASFGEVIALKDIEVFRKAYNNFEYIFYGVLAWAFTCTALLIMPFMNVYTANFADFNYIRPDVAALFVLVGVANNIRIPPNIVVAAAGHFRETQYRAILEAVVNIVASLILVQYLGLVGVLLGSVCSYSYRTIDFILYAAKHIHKQSPLGSLRRLVVNGLLGFVSALPFILLWPIVATNYLEWFLWATGVSLSVLAVIVAGNVIADYGMFRTTLGRLKALTSRA